MEKIRVLVEKYREQVTAHRHWFHQHPETSGQEKNTAAYIAAALREMGLEPTENVGGYGITAVIEGTGEGKCVGLRADIDALEITENTGAPFASRNSGVMHACGHDTHAAMLLGAAYVLNELKDRFNGSVKLIFQPSEENAAASGARAMIADGCLENPRVDAIFGQHIWPELPLGKIGLRESDMHAASDRFFITVHGKSSHGGASPQNGVDAIVIAAQIISTLQTIVSRNVAPQQGCVVSIGTIHGGTRYNIVADTVQLEGTCRNLDPAMRATMGERIRRIASGVAESMGGSCEVDYRLCYGVTHNTPETFAMMKEAGAKALGEENVVVPEKATLAGEDFSYYCDAIPCGFAWLGCKEGDGPVVPLHNNCFLPSDEALLYGMRFMVSSALTYLGWQEQTL